MKHDFIINPIAGRGRAKKLLPVIKDLFSSEKELNSHEYTINMTKSPGHATFIAEELVRSGARRIYSVGGDGTLNEVLNGIGNTEKGWSDTTVGVIPAGSGNDFVKSLMPEVKKNPAGMNEKSLKDYLLNTIMAEHRLLDIARVNGRYFVNASSMGFDAEVANTTNILKRKYPIPSRFAYLIGLFKSIMRNYKRQVRIEVDGNAVSKTVLMVVVANGKYYGNGIPIAPSAIPDDNMLDVCIIDWCTRTRILSVLPKVMKGMIESLQEFTHMRGKTIKIHTEDALYINYDGEISSGAEALFEICRQKVRIAVPFPLLAAHE